MTGASGFGAPDVAPDVDGTVGNSGSSASGAGTAFVTGWIGPGDFGSGAGGSVIWSAVGAPATRVDVDSALIVGRRPPTMGAHPTATRRRASFSNRSCRESVLIAGENTPFGPLGKA